MRLRSAGALVLLFLTLGCGGSGGDVSSSFKLIVVQGSEYQTLLGHASIVFPLGTFASTTEVTISDATPPHFADPGFHAIQRTLTLSAPATAQSIDVYYPDSSRIGQPAVVLLSGSEVIGTLPVVRQEGQLAIHIDPAAIPGPPGALLVSICLGDASH